MNHSKNRAGSRLSFKRLPCMKQHSGRHAVGRGIASSVSVELAPDEARGLLRRRSSLHDGAAQHQFPGLLDTACYTSSN